MMLTVQVHSKLISGNIDCIIFPSIMQIPGAYCIQLLLEKHSGQFNQRFFSYGKANGKNHAIANPSFQILPEFFSGKSFMQWAPVFTSKTCLL